MTFLRSLLAILTKDVITELRTREMLSSMLVFALLTVLIFSFALDLRAATAQQTAPGVLWVTVAFAGSLGLSRSMAQEEQNRCFDGMLLAPMDRSTIYLGKAIGNFFFITLVEAVVLPVFAVLFNLPVFRAGVLLTLLLGTAGYAGVGTLFATMAVNTRAREVMLPILLLPAAVPVLMAAVRATGGFLEALPIADVAYWLRLLVVYDVIIVTVSTMLFDFVVEE